MYSRDEVKALTDRVLNMSTAAKADAVEVEFSGGERAGTRWANSTITVNLVQLDQQLSINVRLGNKVGSASTREFDDDSLKAMVDEATDAARAARENPNLAPLVKGPQNYVPVDAALAPMVNFGPGERAEMVRKSVAVCEKKGALGSGYIPKNYQTTCSANSEGLFAYYQYAEAGMILTCRTQDGRGSGWAGITGVKDLSLIDPVKISEIASDKAVKSQKPRAIEPGRYTVIMESRPAARFLSLMTGIFNARAVETGPKSYLSGTERGTSKLGQKVFSDLVTIKSDIGNPILRQTPIMADGTAAKPVTWVENGVLKNLYYDPQYAARVKKDPTPATVNMSLVLEGPADKVQTVEQMVKSTRRGLLISFFWYIRAVDQPTLLNTGMTRDGLFLIENGEIVGPVQNFRWNMSPLVGFNNVTAIGQGVPMHTGEAYDGPGSALVPAVRMDDFYMTSVSPAV
jgi:predicted Zn-dependent protease